MTRRGILALVLICVAAWGLRFLVLLYPESRFGDEDAAFAASGHEMAQEFRHASSARRFEIEETLSMGGRVLWIVAHLIWGNLFPSDGELAWLLPLFAGLAATAALTAAAVALWGRSGGFAVFLLASLSPLVLNYSVSLRGVMLATMWLSLAIVLLARSTSIASWALAGLCLGLAFGTHYGSGVSILAIAIGLAYSLLRRMRRQADDPWLRALAGPAAGAISSLLPLLMLEAWARVSGGRYFSRLRSHENLGFEELGLGPPGLWLRELLELEPLFPILLTALVVVLLRELPQWREGVLAAGGFLFAALLISFQGAALRSYLSIGGSALLGLLLGLYLARRIEPAELRPNPPAGEGRGALDASAIAVSVAVAVLLYTFFRPLSAMPRLVFGSWPLFALGLTAVIVRLSPGMRHALLLPASALAIACFTLGAWAVHTAKASVYRAEEHARRQPEMRQLRYEDFFTFRDRKSNCESIARRARPEVVVYGPPATLYPAIPYDEEPYKIGYMRDCIREFGLGDVLTPEKIVFARILYVPSAGGSGESEHRSEVVETEAELMRRGLDFLHREGQPAAAVAIFREVLTRNPGHYGAKFQLAAALEKDGQHDAAKAAWLESLAAARAIGDEQTIGLIEKRLAER